MLGTSTALIWCALTVLASGHGHGLNCGHSSEITAHVSWLASTHVHRKGALYPSLSQRENVEQLSAPRSLAENVTISQNIQFNPRPMRMSIQQQQLDGSLSPPELDLLHNVTGAVATLVSRLFKVRHPPGKGGLLGYPPCEGETVEDASGNAEGCSNYNKQPQCGRASVLEKHLVDPFTCKLNPSGGRSSCGSYDGGSDGEDTDLYLYVTSVQDGACNDGAAAWAVPCVLDLTTNRPVIATVNLCPKTLKDATPDRVTALMMHELLHGLGFSSSLFSAYINPDTLESKGEDAIRKVMKVDGKEVLIIISETVRREARAQFDCQELEGAAFEDEGGVGSADAHWEFTHFQGDLMLASTRSSVAREPPRISRITMALMEDTGWYLGNWSAVGPLLQYAQGVGCTLPQRGCAAMLQEQQQQQQSSSFHSLSSSGSLFCSPSPLTENKSTRCTSSHKALGQCETGIQFANGCGMAVATDDLPMCTLPNQMYPNPLVFGWRNAPSSRCFDIGLDFTAKSFSGSSPQSDSPSVLTFPEGGSKNSSSAACFPSKCQNGQHFVGILGQEFRCRAGEILYLAQLMPDVFSEGYIGPCPEEAKVCQTHCPSCSPLGGVCHEGKCHCKLGYEGEACERNLVGVVSLGKDPAEHFVVDKWYETLEVTLGLEGSSSEQPLEKRGQMLARAFASWSNLPLERMKLAKFTRSAVDTARKNQQTSSGASMGVSLQGDAGNVGAVRAPLKRMGGRRLHQHAHQIFNPGIWQGSLQQPCPRRMAMESKGFGMAEREQDLKRGRTAAEEIQAAAEENKVVFHTHPTNKELTNLSVRLASDDQLQLLSQALRQEGFQMKEGSVFQRLALLREKAVELEEGDDGDQEGGGQRLDQTEVVIVGCVVGVGGALLLALLTLASIWWTKSPHSCCCTHPHALPYTRSSGAHILKEKSADHSDPDFASASHAVYEPHGGWDPCNSKGCSAEDAHKSRDSGALPASLPVRESNISAAIELSASSAGPSLQSSFTYPPPIFSPTPYEEPCNSTAHQLGASIEHEGPLFHRKIPSPAPCPREEDMPPDDFPSISPVGSPRCSDSHGLEGTPIRKVIRHAASSNQVHSGSHVHPGVEKSWHSGTCSSTALDLQHQPQKNLLGYVSHHLTNVTQGGMIDSCPSLVPLNPNALSFRRLPHVPDYQPSQQQQQQQQQQMLQRNRPPHRASAPQATGHQSQESTYYFSYTTPTKRQEATRIQPPSPATPKQAGFLSRTLQSMSPTLTNTGQQQQQQQSHRPPHRASAPQVTDQVDTERDFYFSYRTPPKRSHAAGPSPLSHTTYSPASEPPPKRPSLLARALLGTFTPNKVQQDQPRPQQQQQQPSSQQQVSRWPPHRASAPQAQEGGSTDNYHFSYTSPARRREAREVARAAQLGHLVGGHIEAQQPFSHSITPTGGSRQLLQPALESKRPSPAQNSGNNATFIYTYHPPPSARSPESQRLGSHAQGLDQEQRLRAWPHARRSLPVIGDLEG